MVVYYVDANELDGIASATAGARNDLHWTLRPLEAGAWAVPFQRDTQAQWGEIRHLINSELSMLDNDSRALRDRAQRVRVCAAERRIWELLQIRGLEAAEGIFGSAHTIALRAISISGRGGKYLISGPQWARTFSGLGKATRVNPGTFWNKIAPLGKVFKYGGWGLTVAFNAWENQSMIKTHSLGTFLSATAVDSLLMIGIGAAAIAIVGAGAPVLAVLAAAAVGGIVGSLFVDWLRGTPLYKNFVNTTGKLIDHGIDLGRNAIKGVGNFINGAGTSIDRALKFSFA